MCAKKMASVNVHAFSAGSVCTHTFITIVEQNFSVNLIADQRKLVLFLLLCFCFFFFNINVSSFKTTRFSLVSMHVGRQPVSCK